MKAKVVGIQKVDYTNKVGKHVVGTSLHTIHDMKNVDGQAAESIYISATADIPAVNNVKVGSMVEVSYNRYGSVDNIAIL